jgi:branched-subunit amino acid aminotransferase/4-amino-4-deoxychorismate lyase
MVSASSASRRADFLAWHWESGEIAPFGGGVPLQDRGFRYGQHLFESIAIRHGAPLLAEEHLEILSASAKTRGIPFARALMARLRSFLSSITLDDGMLRLYLTAGAGAPGAPITQPGFYMTWEPTHFPTWKEIEKGYDVVLLKKTFQAEGWGIKSGNYGAHLEALQTARDEGADEGIVCDGRGKILSCAMGNLLVWMASPKSARELVICTPSSNVGARRGAVLQWISRQTPALVEQELQMTDLRRARAMAITNSRLGVMPVAMLDGRNLPELSNARELAHHYLYAHGLLGSS